MTGGVLKSSTRVELEALEETYRRRGEKVICSMEKQESLAVVEEAVSST